MNKVRELKLNQIRNKSYNNIKNKINGINRNLVISKLDIISYLSLISIECFTDEGELVFVTFIINGGK